MEAREVTFLKIAQTVFLNILEQYLIFRIQSCNVLNDIQINSLVSGHVLKLWLFFPLEYSTTQPENGTCCFGATWINLWTLVRKRKNKVSHKKTCSMWFRS